MMKRAGRILPLGSTLPKAPVDHTGTAQEPVFSRCADLQIRLREGSLGEVRFDLQIPSMVVKVVDRNARPRNQNG
jgi:hypothetical protein